MRGPLPWLPFAALLVLVALAGCLSSGNVVFSGGRWVSDVITCVFDDRTVEHECYSDKARCKGLGSCSVKLLGQTTEIVSWKSDCLGNAITIMDGRADEARFQCGAQFREQVKCVFSGSNSVQECKAGKWGCKGTGTCLASVQGKARERLSWESPCTSTRSAPAAPAAAKPVTVVDGRNELVEFKCLGDVSEQVRCVFLRSNSVEECKSAKAACKGKGSCLATVKGARGERVFWKATCTGFALSKIDGVNESAVFKCG